MILKNGDTYADLVPLTEAQFRGLVAVLAIAKWNATDPTEFRVSNGRSTQTTYPWNVTIPTQVGYKLMSLGFVRDEINPNVAGGVYFYPTANCDALLEKNENLRVAVHSVVTTLRANHAESVRTQP